MRLILTLGIMMALVAGAAQARGRHGGFHTPRAHHAGHAAHGFHTPHARRHRG